MKKWIHQRTQRKTTSCSSESSQGCWSCCHTNEVCDKEKSFLLSVALIFPFPNDNRHSLSLRSFQHISWVLLKNVYAFIILSLESSMIMNLFVFDRGIFIKFEDINIAALHHNFPSCPKWISIKFYFQKKFNVKLTIAATDVYGWGLLGFRARGCMVGHMYTVNKSCTLKGIFHSSN